MGAGIYGMAQGVAGVYAGNKIMGATAIIGGFGGTAFGLAKLISGLHGQTIEQYGGMGEATQCLIILILFTANILVAQVRDLNRIPVLKANHVGKEFKYNNTDGTVTYLKYLGALTSDKDVKFKVMTSVWILGLSHRATNRILIFSNANHYVGNYYLTTSDDLPSYVKDNKLVFENTGSDCNPKLLTYIDFTKGIPEQFFRKCKGEFGDIYSFGKD